MAARDSLLQTRETEDSSWKLSWTRIWWSSSAGRSVRWQRGLTMSCLLVDDSLFLLATKKSVMSFLLWLPAGRGVGNILPNGRAVTEERALPFLHSSAGWSVYGGALTPGQYRGRV